MGRCRRKAMSISDAGVGVLSVNEREPLACATRAASRATPAVFRGLPGLPGSPGACLVLRMIGICRRPSYAGRSVTLRGERRCGMADESASGRGKWMALTAALLGWLFDGLEMGLFPLTARD